MLFEMDQLSPIDPQTKSISFVNAEGRYLSLFKDCKIIQVDTKERANEVPYLTDEMAMLAPNLKIQLEMCLVQDLFLKVEDKVALRIRIEIERPSTADDYNPVAHLKIISRQGRSWHGIGKVVVNGNDEVIDYGIEPLNLAHKKPHQNEGNAAVGIIFDDS